MGKKLSHIIHIACPMCSMRRPLNKTGMDAALRGIRLKSIKGIYHFGRFDLGKARVVQKCACYGNPSDSTKPKGFPVVGGMTISEMAREPGYSFLVEEILQQAKEIVRLIEDARSEQ